MLPTAAESKEGEIPKRTKQADNPFFVVDDDLAFAKANSFVSWPYLTEFADFVSSQIALVWPMHSLILLISAIAGSQIHIVLLYTP